MYFSYKVQSFCYNNTGGAETCRKIVNILSFNFATCTSNTFWNIFGGGGKKYHFLQPRWFKKYNFWTQ